MLTISNQITASPTETPFIIDRRRTRTVTLRHLSWWQVLTTAILQYEHRRVSDPDQAWVLSELIAYLSDEHSGAGGFEDMGEHWVAVREAARQGTLRGEDRGPREVASRWEQFVEFVALSLQQELGRNVTSAWWRQGDAAARSATLTAELAEFGRLSGAVNVPDTVAPIELQADLRARQFTTSVAVPAPRDGRPKTRINWLLRQLTTAPDQLRIDVSYPNQKQTSSDLLSQVREAPERLLSKVDPTRDPRAFRLVLARELGAKRGKGKGSFVTESKDQTLAFYRDVVQRVRAWTPAPPRLPDAPATTDALPFGAAPQVPTDPPDG